MSADTLRIAVVTGDHPFQEQKFDALFEAMEGVEFTREDLAEFVRDPKRPDYDAAVFYNFHQQNPDPETADALLSLTERGQGVVILHHAILAWLQWDEFGRLCGLADRTFGYHIAQRLPVHVADTAHPITAGLADWEMTDESYTMASPGEDSHALLTVEHPLSMKVIAWTRTYRKSRVFCLQSGHDNRTYRVPEFRETLRRGIHWTAGRL